VFQNVSTLAKQRNSAASVDFGAPQHYNSSIHKEEMPALVMLDF
jgi:hypothetical protein